MIALLILLALSWFVRKWFVGATPEDVEDFFICEEATGEGRGED
jgi:hypothetical protein